jgi:fluoride exporter
VTADRPDQADQGDQGDQADQAALPHPDRHRRHDAEHGPVDPDVDLHDPAQRDELHHHHPKVLGAIAAGGVLGAEARYGLAEALPHAAGTFPWATLVTNLSGSLLIGVLMAWLVARRRPAQLARPLLGVGVLGGYTTFSTYAVDLRELIGHHQAGPAAAYLVATLAGGIAAVMVGLRTTEALLPKRRTAQVQA